MPLYHPHALSLLPAHQHLPAPSWRGGGSLFVEPGRPAALGACNGQRRLYEMCAGVQEYGGTGGGGIGGGAAAGGEEGDEDDDDDDEDDDEGQGGAAQEYEDEDDDDDEDDEEVCPGRLLMHAACRGHCVLVGSGTPDSHRREGLPVPVWSARCCLHALR